MEKTLLYVDSDDRDKGEINDFSINLEVPRHRIKQIEVHSVEIPNVIYPIRSNYNNVFKFIDTGSVLRTVNIPDGSYNIDDLLNYIKVSMDKHDGTYNLTYSSSNYKITIAETGENNFSLKISNNVNSIWKLLGFKGVVDLTGSNSYTANSIFNLSHEPSYIYLKSTLVHSSRDKIISANKKGNRSYVNCLCKIPLEVPFGEIIHHRPYIPMTFKVEERSLTNVRFWLEDNNGNLLPMDRDWSIGIILYSQPDNFNFFTNNS